MTTEQQMVMRFMRVFGNEVKHRPGVPSLEVRKLRAILILEEALETIQALGFNVMFDSNGMHSPSAKFVENNKLNLEQIADGLADLHYVAYCGTALACGIDMEPIFKEVHRSNMSKLWTAEEINNPSNRQPVGIATPVWFNNLSFVKNEFGKVIKSPSYSPANIQAELNKQLV